MTLETNGLLLIPSPLLHHSSVAVVLTTEIIAAYVHSLLVNPLHLRRRRSDTGSTSGRSEGCSAVKPPTKLSCQSVTTPVSHITARQLKPITGSPDETSEAR